MSQKTHPTGFRLGITKEWQTKWFAQKPKDYRSLVLEDLTIRNSILSSYPDAGISRVEIERGSIDVVIAVHTARPGIVIGRGGQRVEELRKTVEGLIEKRARLNIQEIRQPELDAYLVARSVADQLERRIAFRRAIRQAVARTMQAGAKGVKIICAGRLGGADIARTEKAMQGRVPLHTLRADIRFRHRRGGHRLRPRRRQGLDIQGRHRPGDGQGARRRRDDAHRSHRESGGGGDHRRCYSPRG